MNSYLFITLEYPPDIGGVGEYVAGLAGALPAGGAVVLAPPRPNAARFELVSNARVIRTNLVGNFLPPRWRAAIKPVTEIVRRDHSAAIVVSHLLPMGTVARIVGKRDHVPYVVIVHGLDIALAKASGGRKLREAKNVLADAAFVIANSDFTASLLTGVCDPKKVRVIRPSPAPLSSVTAQDVALVKKEHGLHGFVVLTTARLVRRKGIDLLIAAMSILAKQGREAMLVVVGDGPERAGLAQLAVQLGVWDRVVFTGVSPREELSALYAACDIFCMLPRVIGHDVEGFGIVYLEAAMHGRPSVGTRSGGVPDAVIDGKTGILVEPEDPEAAAEAIAKLMDDQKLRERLGANAKRRVESEFGWDRAAAAFIAVMESMTGKSR